MSRILSLSPAKRSHGSCSCREGTWLTIISTKRALEPSGAEAVVGSLIVVENVLMRRYAVAKKTQCVRRKVRSVVTPNRKADARLRNTDARDLPSSRSSPVYTCVFLEHTSAVACGAQTSSAR